MQEYFYYFKSNILLVILSGILINNQMVISQDTIECLNPIPGSACHPFGSSTDNPNNNLKDGNGDLGVFYDYTACGLNYVQDSKMTTNRHSYYMPGTGLPTNLDISGIPPCATIEKAFLWWMGSGSANNPDYTFNGTPGSGSLIGVDGHKCWLSSGTESYRADVTNLVSGNGVYTFSQPIGDSIDGVTLMVIYSDPNASYQGSIRMADGAIANVPANQNTATHSSTLTGMNVCANTTSAKAFVLVSDMQSDISPTHVVTANGDTQTFPNSFVNFDETNTTFNSGQTNCVFEVVPGFPDCWLWVMMGTYYQTTSCTTCSIDSLILASDSVDANCNSCDGTANVYPSGGSAPYTYSWNDPQSQTTQTASGLCPGQYVVQVTDASGCLEAYDTVVVNEASCSGCNMDSLIITPGPCSSNSYDIMGEVYFTDPPTTGSLTITDSCSGIDTTFNAPFTSPLNWSLYGLPAGNGSCVVSAAFSADTNCQLSNTYPQVQPCTCSASIIGSNDATCNGASDGDATAAGSDPNTTYNYTWNTIPAQHTQTATGLSAGTYVCVVTDVNTGCADTVSVLINEPSLLTSDAGDDTTICTGGNAIIAGTGVGGTPGYTYSWDNGLGAGQTHNVSPIATTVYNVTVTDANGCTATDAVSVMVSTPLTITASSDVHICPGGQAEISAQAGAGSGNGGPYTYSWNNGLGEGQNQSVAPNDTTTYVVILTDGCSPPVSDSVTVYINPVPEVDFLVDTFSICESPQHAFTFWNTTDTTGGMVGSSVWNFGDGNTEVGDTVWHTYDGPGSYNVTLTVTSTVGAGGCTTTLTKNAYVHVYSNPTADFIMDPNPTTTFNPTVNFNDQSYTNIADWSWSLGGLDISSLQNPTYTFPYEAGEYPVTLTVVDNNGCENTTTKILIVKGEYGVWVPNAFTPDFDQFNNGFYPNGFGISDYDYGFYIFNRWGELIFESHDKFEPWDGTYKGKTVPDGVYVWKLEFRDINGNSHSKVGSVTLIK